MKYSIIILSLLFHWSNCIENCAKSQIKTIEGSYCYKKCSKKIFGICTEHDTVCEKTEKNEEVCSQCIYGYVLNKGNSCIKGIDNCYIHKENANPPICTKCEDDYELLSNKCVPYIEGCIEYSKTTNLCEKCDTNYVLYENSHICLEKKTNCESHNIENDKLYCRICETNYILDSMGNCNKNSKNYNNNDNNDNNCGSGKIKINNQCIIQIENCIKYSSYSGTNFSFCLNCKTGYSLQFGNCLFEGNLSLIYYIKLGNFFIKINFGINKFAENIKSEIPFKLILKKEKNYYYSQFNSIDYQIYEDYINYNNQDFSTSLSSGDIILIFPDILAFVYSSYIENSNYIKVGKINEINILNNINTFDYITLYSSYANINKYCNSSVFNPYSKFLTAKDWKINLYSRTSIPLNKIPNLYLNGKISIKNSCSLKENKMIVKCNIKPYRKQLDSQTTYKVLESCDGCQNMLDTEFYFDIDKNSLNDLYLELNKLLFYIFIIFIL